MQESLMWKQLWKTWTLDKPAAFGDWLWEMFVVQLAALLDRVTLRDVIAFIPVLILIVAYAHSIPIPPELMLVGDLLAYIDVFSLIFLVSLMTRVSTVLFIAKQAAQHMIKLASSLLAGMQRQDFRHRRQGGAKSRKRTASQVKSGDDEGYAAIRGVAWA
jgi:hypothetical protein